MKALRIILGVLALIAGIICMANPFGTQLAIGFILSIFIGIMGIMMIVDFIVNGKKRKKAGLDAAAGISGLVLGILGLVFFLFNLIPGFTYGVQGLIAILLMISLIVEGVITIVTAFIRDWKGVGVRVLMVILGAIMLGGGIAGLVVIPFVVGLLGVFTAVGIFILGIELVVSGCMDETD